jgi:hypothetical protein
MTTITQDTPLDVEGYRALTIAKALELYAKTGMKVNRAYTPTAMLKAANEITGHTYRRGQHTAAALALREWVERRVTERRAAGAKPNP